MNPVDAMPRIRKPTHLFRKLVLLTLLTAAYALGLILLLPKVPWFPLILFVVFANGALALVAGFGTRLLLSGRGWFIRAIVAAVLPVVGMAVLGYFSDWEIGIDVLALSLGYVSWTDLAQLLTGVLVSWAALWSWHRPARREVHSVSTAGPVRSTRVVQPRRVRSNRSWSLGTRLRTGTGTSARPGSGGSRGRARLVSRQPSRPRRPVRALVRRPHVQLALVEEHRCPYCLEPVVRTDPRGVKECEICHTLHHADCWAITGTCQVPHLND
jgi:ribosomal protein L37AE/L43A